LTKKNWTEKPVTRSLDEDGCLITIYEIEIEESGKEDNGNFYADPNIPFKTIAELKEEGGLMSTDEEAKDFKLIKGMIFEKDEEQTDFLDYTLNEKKGDEENYE